MDFKFLVLKRDLAFPIIIFSGSYSSSSTFESAIHRKCIEIFIKLNENQIKFSISDIDLCVCITVSHKDRERVLTIAKESSLDYWLDYINLNLQP